VTVFDKTILGKTIGRGRVLFDKTILGKTMGEEEFF